MSAFEVEFERELEEPRGARIVCVHAMAKPGHGQSLAQIRLRVIAFTGLRHRQVAKLRPDMIPGLAADDDGSGYDSLGAYPEHACRVADRVVLINRECPRDEPRVAPLRTSRVPRHGSAAAAAT